LGTNNAFLLFVMSFWLFSSSVSFNLAILEEHSQGRAFEGGRAMFKRGGHSLWICSEGVPIDA
jgi:hypothetical protein